MECIYEPTQNNSLDTYLLQDKMGLGSFCAFHQRQVLSISLHSWNTTNLRYQVDHSFPSEHSSCARVAVHLSNRTTRAESQRVQPFDWSTSVYQFTLSRPSGQVQDAFRRRNCTFPCHLCRNSFSCQWRLLQWLKKGQILSLHHHSKQRQGYGPLGRCKLCHWVSRGAVSLQKRAGQKLPLGLRRWKEKFASGWIGVGSKLKYYKCQDHSKCPLCNAPSEKVSHVLHCKDPTAV